MASNPTLRFRAASISVKPGCWRAVLVRALARSANTRTGSGKKGSELREARKQQGMTQREQVLLLGISPLDLNDVECDRRVLEDVPRVRFAKE